MSNNYTYSNTNINTTSLEKEIELLDNITDWNEKIKMMKNIKSKLTEEQDKLNMLFNDINNISDNNNNINNNINNINNDDNLKLLIEKFEKETNIYSKVELYKNINFVVKKIEKELFS
jgi:hypothetical protein